MPKPELSHYPVWLREELFPDDPFNSRKYSRQSLLEHERALRQVFNNRRSDQACLVLSELVLKVIRQEFRDSERREAYVKALQDHLLRINALEEQVAKLEKENKRRKRGVKK